MGGCADFGAPAFLSHWSVWVGALNFLTQSLLCIAAKALEDLGFSFGLGPFCLLGPLRPKGPKGPNGLK